MPECGAGGDLSTRSLWTSIRAAVSVFTAVALVAALPGNVSSGAAAEDLDAEPLRPYLGTGELSELASSLTKVSGESSIDVADVLINDASELIGENLSTVPRASVEELLAAVRALPPLIESLDVGEHLKTVSASRMVRQAVISAGLDATSKLGISDHGRPSDAAVALLTALGHTPSTGDLAQLAVLDSQPASVATALSRTFGGFVTLHDASRDIAASVASLDRRAMARLADIRISASDLSRILTDGEFRRESLGRHAELLQLATPEVAQAVAQAVIAQAGLFAAVQTLEDALTATTSTSQASSSGEPIQVGQLLSIDLSEADNSYAQDYALLVDVGGDDTYTNNAGGGIVGAPGEDRCLDPREGGPAQRAAALIDLAGHDQYLPADRCAVNGGATLGVGFLYDAAGNDDYHYQQPPPFDSWSNSGLVSDTPNGSAYIGAGFLFDGAGNDSYQGFNALGALGGSGFLFDARGRDDYLGFAGAGLLGGTGLVIDGGGRDAYEGATGYGAAGGFGLVLDAAGNDHYQGANGVGFIFGAGALVDLSGFDTYGAAANPAVAGNGFGGFGAGLLLDGGGDDVYPTLTGNAFGLLGAGFLIDGAGNDTYTARELGNGWAGAGVAVLFDGIGDDTYHVGDSSDPIVASGNATAGLGSAVLFDAGGNDSYTVEDGFGNGFAVEGTAALLDAQGDDAYSDPGNGSGENTTVAPKGTVGAQVDLPIPAPPSSTTTTTTTNPSTTTTEPPPPPTGNNVGGGTVQGSVSFDAPGVPPVLDPCTDTTFTYTGTVDGAVVNTAATSFAGPVTITGGGGSQCENALFAEGTLDVEAHGEGPDGSTIDCASLTGTYRRVLLTAGVDVRGRCEINGFATADVTFVAALAVHPEAEDTGAGVTGPLEEASFEGSFTMSPE